MATKCEKRGCEKEALNTLRFHDLIHIDVDTDNPVVLCGEHTMEVDKFAKADIAAVKRWLGSLPVETIA